MKSSLAFPLFLGLAPCLFAETAPDFKKDILPIFEDKCFSCHSVSKGKTKGGLALDADEISLHIGKASHPINAGHGEDSDLVKMLEGGDDYDLMPPVGKGDPLTASQIKAVVAWIDAGASLEKAKDEKPALSKASQEHTWTNAEGKAIKATLLKLEEGKAHLKLSNGKVAPYPLEKLSEASRKLAEELGKELSEAEKSEAEDKKEASPQL